MTAQDAYLHTMIEDLHEKPAFIGDLDACYEQGACSADQARPRESNPYAAGTKEAAWWDGGWCQSGDDLCGPKQ